MARRRRDRCLPPAALGAVFHRLTSAPRQGSDVAALLEGK